MASVRMGLSPVVMAAKAREEPSFMDWLDNAFQKKEGFSETSKVLVDLKAGKAKQSATVKKAPEPVEAPKPFWKR